MTSQVARRRVVRRLSYAALSAMILLTACSRQQQHGQSTPTNPRADAILTDVSDGRNWAGEGRTFDQSHFSPLDQIDSGNLKTLGLVWAQDLPVTISALATPVAAEGRLFVAQGLSIISAFDAATGRLLWRFDPHVGRVAGDKLTMAWGIRGIAYYDGRIYTGTQDGRLIAIDAANGHEDWSVQTTSGPTDGLYITGAPVTFDGKVIIGNGGSDFQPVRGYVTAYDAASGRQVWRFYTVPGNP